MINPSGRKVTQGEEREKEEIRKNSVVKSTEART
jgi:hypothetical protein